MKILDCKQCGSGCGGSSRAATSGSTVFALEYLNFKCDRAWAKYFFFWGGEFCRDKFCLSFAPRPLKTLYRFTNFIAHMQCDQRQAFGSDISYKLLLHMFI